MFFFFIVKLAAFFGILGYFGRKAIKKETTTSKDVYGRETSKTHTSVNLVTAAVGVVSAIISLTLLSSFGTIGAGERGTVTRFGAVTGRIAQPGLYWVLPFFEGMHMTNVQTQKEAATAEAVSKDLQSVKTQIALNYSVKPNSVAMLYKEVGDSYKEKLIDPAIQEAIKSVTAKFTAESLVVNRHRAKEMTINELNDRMSNYFQIEAVNMTDFDFDPNFKAAIEAKVTSNQLALKAKNDAEIVFNTQREKFYTASADSNVTIAAAKAEAEAIRIKTEAIRQQGGAEYVRLKAIEKWNGDVPTWVTGSNIAPIPFVDAPNRKDK